MKAWWERLAILRASMPTMTMEELANDPGIQKSKSTVFDALQKPEVVARINDLINGTSERITEQPKRTEQSTEQEPIDISKMRSDLITKALATMRELLDSDTTPPQVKARVSADILKGYGEFSERQEVEHTGGCIVVPGIANETAEVNDPPSANQDQ